MSVATDLLAAAAEVQACDVRLRLLSQAVDSGRNDHFRRELLERRDAAAARLAELEAEYGWSRKHRPVH